MFTKILLLDGRLGAGPMSPANFDFPDIFLFPKILNLRLLDDYWGHSCTKILILDIKLRFTCGEPNLYLYVGKFKKIMTRIVGVENKGKNVSLLSLMFFP